MCAIIRQDRVRMTGKMKLQYPQSQLVVFQALGYLRSAFIVDWGEG